MYTAWKILYLIFELIVKETQHGWSPATFSRNLVDHFGIIGHNIQTGSEAINPTENITFA